MMRKKGKAYFEATQNLALTNIEDYIKLVTLRNEYAGILGFKDFYEYKLHHEEKMSKAELF